MQQKMRWVVGANMPGYMPDGDVSHFPNWADARDCFIADVERAIEDSDNPQCYKIERGTIERLRKQHVTGEAQTKIGDYIYWLMKL